MVRSRRTPQPPCTLYRTPTDLFLCHLSPCPSVSCTANEFPISLISPRSRSEHDHHGDAAQTGQAQLASARQFAVLAGQFCGLISPLPHAAWSSPCCKMYACTPEPRVLYSVRPPRGEFNLAEISCFAITIRSLTMIC